MHSVRPALLALLLLLVARPGLAEHAEIEDLEAVVLQQSVSLRFHLRGAFGHGVTLDALQSGLPVVFLYQIDLIRKRENWFDAILSSSEIEAVATYNSVTREYLLNYRRDRKLVSSESVRSIEDLERKMTTISEPSLFPLGKEDPARLRVRARAVLGRRYLLHVIPRWIATEWEVVRVRSPRGDR